jgi:hypothetical protein
MNSLAFPYVSKAHAVYGQISRPVTVLHFFSERFQNWVQVGNVLIDTGADISLVGLPIGQLLVTDVNAGIPFYLSGVAKYNQTFDAFVHSFRVRLGTYEFTMPIAITLAEIPPAILGRLDGLDRFDISFSYGEAVTFSWPTQGTR